MLSLSEPVQPHTPGRSCSFRLCGNQFGTGAEQMAEPAKSVYSGPEWMVGDGSEEHNLPFCQQQAVLSATL